MKKIFFAILSLIIITSCHRKECSTTISNVAIKISNDAKLKWVAIDGKNEIQTNVDIFAENNLDRPIDSLTNITVYIGRYGNEAILKKLWIESDLGEYNTIHYNCVVWICSNKTYVAIDN